MKKLYRIFFLLLIFIFLTTYTSLELDKIYKEKNFFGIKKIKIINNKLISSNHLIDKLSSIYDRNILFLKGSDIQSLLNSTDFLEKISVKKKYPDTIIIKVIETRPIAILFKNNKNYILDTSSKIINKNEKIKSKNLPKIFGPGAQYSFVNFFKILKQNDFPVENVKFYYHFKIDRWDLQLLNDLLIKLPEKNTEEAIIKVTELLNRSDFKNYKVIDLRVPNKIVVE